MFEKCQTPNCVGGAVDRENLDIQTRACSRAVGKPPADSTAIDPRFLANVPAPVPESSRSEVVCLDEEDVLEALQNDLDDDLLRCTKEVLTKGYTRPKCGHEKVRSLWNKFWAVADHDQFRSLCMSPQAAWLAKRRTPVMVAVHLERQKVLDEDLVRQKVGLGFGVHCSLHDQTALFIDKIEQNGILDVWNRGARERCHCCVHPLAAILAVNDHMGDAEAMKEELTLSLKGSTGLKTRLVVVNPPGVEEAIAVMDLLRSGEKIKWSFWDHAARWEDTESQVLPVQPVSVVGSVDPVAAAGNGNLGVMLGRAADTRRPGRDCADGAKLEGECGYANLNSACGLGGRVGKTTAV